nr:immunoglobulin heavy chain junction region [Mus musculus]
CARSLGSSDYW